MKIALLIIASEVLDGKITDSNTLCLSQFLRAHHHELSEVLSIRDDQSVIENSLAHLLSKHDVVITSGGLGPTQDDITKISLGSFLGRALSFSPMAREIAEQNYQRMGKVFPGDHHTYCTLPEGFTALSNSSGFAPSFSTLGGEKVLMSAPGVPREFKSFLEDHFLKLTENFREKNDVIEDVIIRTKFIPEEKIFSEVDPTLWEKLASYGVVSSLPHLLGVDVGVKITALDEAHLNLKKNNVIELFKSSPISPFIWSWGNASLEQRIVKAAKEKKIKYGFAESATGGLCSHRITSIAGSSENFMGSVVSYDESVKEKILGVSPLTLEKSTAVSEACALEMCLGIREKLNLDVGVSITGYAGPSGQDVGKVYIGVSYGDGLTDIKSYQFYGDRESLKLRFSQAALYLLLEKIERLS